MNEHCCPIACNPYKGDRECFFLEKNFHAHCLTCPSNGREQSLPSRALLVFDETNKFPSFHFFLYISRALLGLSHDARLRDTHIFLFHAHCLTCFTMRVCAIHIFLFYARCLWKWKRLWKKKKENDATTASFSHLFRFTFMFHISRALLDLSHDARLRDTHIFLFHAHCLTCLTMRDCAIHIFLFHAHRLWKWKRLSKKRKQRDNRVVLSFPSFFFCFPHLTRIAWLVLQRAIHVFFFSRALLLKMKKTLKKKKKTTRRSSF